MMKIHIIVFCQLAPNGAAPPPQCDSITAASECSITYLLEDEEDEQQISPDAGQEMPERREQRERVRPRLVASQLDAHVHDGVPDEGGRDVHDVDARQQIEER